MLTFCTNNLLLCIVIYSMFLLNELMLMLNVSFENIEILYILSVFVLIIIYNET